MAIGEVSTNTDATVKVTHQFVNSTDQEVTLNWVDCEGQEHCYQTLGAGHSSSQETYSTHLWRLRWPSRQVLGCYVGAGAVVEILGPGKIRTQPLDLSVLMVPDPAWGQWRQRGKAAGIPIHAYDCVSDKAVIAACVVVQRMLSHCPTHILARLIQAGACVGVIGRTQLTSDMPGHQHLKLSKGGRDLDGTTRGLGGNEGCPMCTCGEENLDMVNDSRYPYENILVHEFAHTVMTLGMSEGQRRRVKTCYQAALDNNLYAKGCYALENEDEYWAEGTQSWFDATVRDDVNGGVNTREKLAAHDPGLAAIMNEVWGANQWRYPHDAPAPFAGQESSKTHTYANPSPFSTYTHSHTIPRPLPSVQPNGAYVHPPGAMRPYDPHTFATAASYGSHIAPYVQQTVTSPPYAHPAGAAHSYAQSGGGPQAYPQIEPASASLCGSWNPFAACFPQARSTKHRPAYSPPHVQFSPPSPATWRDPHGYSADSKTH